MPEPTPPDSVIVPEWYGYLATSQNGISCYDVDNPYNLYLEKQFQSRLVAGVATEVLRVAIGTGTTGRSQSYFLELMNYVATAGNAVTFGSIQQYQVTRMTIPATGGSSIVQFGFVNRTTSGTSPAPTYTASTVAVNGTVYLVLTILTAAETFVAGTLTVTGVR